MKSNREKKSDEYRRLRTRRGLKIVERNNGLLVSGDVVVLYKTVKSEWINGSRSSANTMLLVSSVLKAETANEEFGL